MDVKRIFRIIVVCWVALLATPRAHALSLALDSIAQWGKFPRFVVNTYRWGDGFFNGYDKDYVQPTGTKFNVKLMSNSWFDYYHFMLPGGNNIIMRGDPSTSVGPYITYLAVSAGYDINVREVFGGTSHSRRRWRFGFNCALLAVELYWINNDVGTSIHRFGPRRNLQTLHMPFKGINIDEWGMDAYYFFNNKHYSEAAAFNYSRVQRRNAGSFFAGIAFYNQRYNFDFNELPEWMKIQLPEQQWGGYKYNVSTKNYAVRLGYGYNWVPRRNLVIGLSESPIIGVRSGEVTGAEGRHSFSLYNRAKVSVVWNRGRWFAGMIGSADVALVYDKQTTLSSAVLSLECAVGYRFNLW